MTTQETPAHTAGAACADAGRPPGRIRTCAGRPRRSAVLPAVGSPGPSIHRHPIPVAGPAGRNVSGDRRDAGSRRLDRYTPGAQP
jgi:hypothetical protein